ncbi:MAG: hypothetical protein PHN51_09245 [Candidatus Nanopelagicales bacterium]|nr:hypothetical protein [Candidatus Nanopelagicales bacterium]
MRTRVMAFVLAIAAAIYAVFVLWRAWSLFESGDPIAIALGAVIIVIPILGLWMIYREVKFGFGMQAMGRSLALTGDLPVDDLPKTASGRADRDAADTRFAECQSEVEQSPQDWQAWYRLALAYDDARDRKRARGAMRQALALFSA